MACILHIETSTNACSVAVSENGQCIYEETQHGEHGAGAEQLGRMVDEALSFTVVQAHTQVCASVYRWQKASAMVAT